MPDPYQVVNLGVIKWASHNRLERQLQLYLILRERSSSCAGYFYLADLEEASRRMQLSLRTIKKHLHKLKELDFIKHDGRNYRIRSLLYIMKLLNVKSASSVVIERRWLTFRPKAFQAYCMVAIQSEFLSNRHKIMSKKGQITINDRRDRSRVKIKLAQTHADHGGYRHSNQGEISLRLNQNLTSYSISYGHRLKKIAQYFGLARYIRTYCPEFDKFQINSFENLLLYLESIGTPTGLDLKRFAFSTKKQIYRKIEADLVQTFVPVIRRNTLSGKRYKSIQPVGHGMC